MFVANLRNLILVLCLLVAHYSIACRTIDDDLMKIAVDTKEFHIKDHNEKDIVSFNVEIVPDSVSKIDKKLCFRIKITNLNPVNNHKIDVSELVFMTKHQANIRTRLIDDHWETNEIKISESEIKNIPFDCIANSISVVYRSEILKIDPIIFHVMPVLSISIPSKFQKINLGRVIFDGETVRSDRKPFELYYTCVSDAKLCISTTNDFHLKHAVNRVDSKIPYKIQMFLADHAVSKHKCNNDPNDTLSALSNSFTGRCDGEIYIHAKTRTIPTAGNYKDTITFNILAE